jgi:hypothetical protein
MESNPIEDKPLASKAELKTTTALLPDFELRIVYRHVDELKPNPKNPRKHSRQQLRFLAKIVKKYGFLVPVIIDADGNIICGHARCEASKKAGISRIPTVQVSHLTDAEIKGLMIADNRIGDLSSFDEIKLGELFIELTVPEVEFDPEEIGFSSGEMSAYVDKLPPVPKDGAPEYHFRRKSNNYGKMVSGAGVLNFQRHQ